MDFRECVIDCIADARLLETFNRNEVDPIGSDELLRVLRDQPSMLDSLPAPRRECVARFLLFVHSAVWRKFKLASARANAE